MSVLRTVEDLRADALFRAGEPQSSTSKFYTRALEYLNHIQQQLILGGTIAVGRDLATSAGIYAHLVDLPMTDFWWARKRGVFNTTTNLAVTLALELTQGASSMTVTGALSVNVIGRYIVIPSNKRTILRVSSTSNPSGNAVITFDAPWPEETVSSGSSVDLAPVEYDLPTDFVRFASPPYLHSLYGSAVPIGTTEQRDWDRPLSILNKGIPTRAYVAGPKRIAFNTYDDRAYRVETEYIFFPPDLVANGDAGPIPEHHRGVLSSGAAMLMLYDKNDSRMSEAASEYRELVGRLVQEHRRFLSSGSGIFGVHLARGESFTSRRRSPQSFGELFLV
jgi:hypothetical protein